MAFILLCIFVRRFSVSSTAHKSYGDFVCFQLSNIIFLVRNRSFYLLRLDLHRFYVILSSTLATVRTHTLGYDHGGLAISYGWSWSVQCTAEAIIISIYLQDKCEKTASAMRRFSDGASRNGRGIYCAKWSAWSISRGSSISRIHACCRPGHWIHFYLSS